jgi:hypothetical protein
VTWPWPLTALTPTTTRHAGTRPDGPGEGSVVAKRWQTLHISADWRGRREANFLNFRGTKKRRKFNGDDG